MEYPINQTSHQRACQDTEKFRKSAKSFWGLEIVGAVVLATIGSVVGYLLTPPSATQFTQFIYPTFGGAFGLILGLIVVFVFIYGMYLLKAPYKQRDEARSELRKQKITLEQMGTIGACMQDATDCRNNLTRWKGKISVLDDHDYEVFQEWYSFVSQYLQKNMYSDYQAWYHDVDIVDKDAPLLEEVLKAYEAGYNILKDIYQRLNQSIPHREGYQN